MPASGGTFSSSGSLCKDALRMERACFSCSHGIQALRGHLAAGVLLDELQAKPACVPKLLVET